MASQNETGYKTFQATAVALTAFARVKIDSNGLMSASGADSDGIGIVQEDVAASGYGTVKLFNAPGTFFVRASAAITRGAKLFPAASGKFDDAAAATGSRSRLVALEAATADNDVIEAAPLLGSFGAYQIVAAGIHEWAGGAATTDSISVSGLEATDIVLATLTARGAAETLEMAANDAANDQIDLTLSANGTNTTTKINYVVLRAA